jgi:hypothetical protein
MAARSLRVGTVTLVTMMGFAGAAQVVLHGSAGAGSGVQAFLHDSAGAGAGSVVQAFLHDSADAGAGSVVQVVLHDSAGAGSGSVVQALLQDSADAGATTALPPSHWALETAESAVPLPQTFTGTLTGALTWLPLSTLPRFTLIMPLRPLALTA